MVVIIHFTTTPASAVAPVPVQVTNTPLPVQGTVNAHINNATVPVSGSVAVSSLPPVQLSGTSPVTFTNTSSTPLFTENEGAARSAVAATCDFVFTDPPSQLSCQLATVPQAQILVIETVTCRATSPPGVPVGPFSLYVASSAISGGSFYQYYDLPLRRASSSSSSSDDYDLISPLRAYALPGTGVSIIGVGQSSPQLQAGISCTIAGHLVAQ